MLANIALSVLDEHFDQRTRQTRTLPQRQRRGRPAFRLSRYADDWVLLVKGERADVETMRDEAATVLATMGLRLSPEKTMITHIDEGLDFLGWRIQRHRKRGTSKSYVYTYPAKKAVDGRHRQGEDVCRQNTNLPLDVLLHPLNPMLRGWCSYFQPGVSSGNLPLPARIHLAPGHRMDPP